MKTILSRTLQQPKQRRPLIATGSTPDDYDEAVMRFYGGKFEKVVSIAGQQYRARVKGKSEHRFAGSISRKHI